MKRLFAAIVVWAAIVVMAMFLNSSRSTVRAEYRAVINNADSGPGSLRQALLDANPRDEIGFDPAAFPPGIPVTIFISSAPLPTIAVDELIIDGSAARVIVHGSDMDGAVGFRITSSGCRISGLTIRNFGGDGIWIEDSASGNFIGGDRRLGRGNVIIHNGGSGVAIRGDSNTIRGNCIGIEHLGRWAAPNSYNGIALWAGASGNIIGGASEYYRNVISGNRQNGIWLGQPGTDSNVIIGNYIGTRADGEGAVPNEGSGLSIDTGAQNNRIGGAGEGNLISGNGNKGIYVTNTGTDGTQILGNLIGVNKTGTAKIGQGTDGVLVTSGASYTTIGSPAAPNVISGSTFDGICLEGTGTMENIVQGNLIGTNVDGSAALPNGLHGVELRAGTHHNQVGGNRLLGEGNLLSGNSNHGLIITGDKDHNGAHDNIVQGNLIGPDKTGSYSLGYQPYGGIDITHGAHDNIIGGLGVGQGNLVSGNKMDGIALYRPQNGYNVTNTQIIGNLIGVALDGSSPLPNVGDFGILIAGGVTGTRIEGNTIAYHQEYGIKVSGCDGQTITANSIYSNTTRGIENEEDCLPNPEITGASLGSTDTVTGTTLPNAWVEFFSDDYAEGRIYEGTVQAGALGDFTFSKAGGLAGPNLTATARDGDGNTSEFSLPAHLAWIQLVYLSGDNDLEPFMLDALTNTVASGPSRQANVLVLMDGYTMTEAYSRTMVYDITRGEAQQLGIPWTVGGECIDGECNMGDPHTLESFVQWGRSYYPARHVMLSIVDHGGGWAPSTGEVITGTMPIRRRFWLNGGSGLSWDFTDRYDYLSSTEIQRAMAAITADGLEPLDVVFFDACLMGMAEVAYQIKDYAAFFVASQNIAWAPLGPEGRYVQIMQGMPPATTPRHMAELVVESYANATPPEEHPFTISAIDLSAMTSIATGIDELAVAISQTLPGLTMTLHTAFSESQKLDYDADLCVEPMTDGFVDIYDFALQASLQFSGTAVAAAAQQVMDAIDTAIVAESHRSGVAWPAPGCPWDLENAHGLSVFLPLGEDLEFPIVLTPTLAVTARPVATDYLHMRDLYTCDQLSFVCDTAWKGMIDAYYSWASVPVTSTQELTRSLLTPDYAAPETIITLTGMLTAGQDITVTWTTRDAGTGVKGAELWYRPLNGVWTVVRPLQPGNAGRFLFTLPHTCGNGIAVRGVDWAGNREPVNSSSNTAILEGPPACTRRLPIIQRLFKRPT